MDEHEFDEQVARLKKVNKAIADLDPTIRGAAFATFGEYITGGASTKPSSGHRRSTRKKTSAKRTNTARSTKPSEPVGDNSELNRDEFFLKFDHDKPSDNALAIAAWHYNDYGKTSFAVGEIQQIANEVGLTLPDRLDKTYSGAKRAKKSCFTSPRPGTFVPTVHGEARLKESYGVKRGNKTKPESGDDD